MTSNDTQIQVKNKEHRQLQLLKKIKLLDGICICVEVNLKFYFKEKGYHPFTVA